MTAATTSTTTPAFPSAAGTADAVLDCSATLHPEAKHLLQAPGWRARMAVVAAGMCAFFTMYVTQGLLPSLQGVFHASVAELSLTITFTTLAVALAAPLSGSLSDRYGRKPVLLCSLAGLSLTTALAATAGSLHALLLWRLLEGLFIPGVFTATVAYIGEEWPARKVPAVTALYISGSVAGGFLGRFIAGMVTAHWGWKAAGPA